MRHVTFAVMSFVVAVMLFASQVRAAIISGETAIATNEDPDDNRVAINVVNDSGITFNSSNLAADGQITHDAEYQNMWTNMNGQGNNAAVGLTLTIDLGGGSDVGYDLGGMRIWNYNGTNGTDQAVDNYDLETSRDGVLWTLRQDDQALAMPAGITGYNGVYTGVNWLDVRFVRFIVNTTARPSEDIGGLSEIMFDGELAAAASASVPEPSTGAIVLLCSAGWCGLNRWRRRSS